MVISIIDLVGKQALYLKTAYLEHQALCCMLTLMLMLTLG